MAYGSLWRSLASDPRGTKGMVIAINQALYDLWDAIAGNTLGWGAEQELEISGGVVTMLTNYRNYILDTEGAAASDELDKFAGVEQGNRLLVRCKSASRPITLVHGTYLRLRGGVNFTLNSVYDNVVLIGTGSGDVCYEESRCSNA